MLTLLPGARAPPAFHHRPIAVNRHVRQAPSHSLGQSLPRKHVEIGSLPRQHALLHANPCAAPSQRSETPACPRAAFSSMDPRSTQNRAHRWSVSTRWAQTPGCHTRNPVGCCLRAVPVPCSLSRLWQPPGERVGKVHPAQLPAPGSQWWRYPLQAVTGGNIYPEPSDLR